MKLLPMDLERSKQRRRHANGTAHRRVRTLKELADEFGVTYQKLARELDLHPEGAPKPSIVHSSIHGGDLKLYDLLLMRSWWRGLQG